MAKHTEPTAPGGGRWILLAVTLLAAAGAGVVSTEPTDATETVIGIFAGVVGFSFWWLVIGALVWLVRLAIRRRREFGQVMLAPAVLAVMLALVVISIPGLIAINAQEEDERLSAPSASAADTEGELGGEQEAIVDYMNGMIRCTEGVSDGRRLERRTVAALKRGDWSSAARLADRQEGNLTAFAGCWRSLSDTGEPELDAASEKVADGIALTAAGWRVYERGSRRRDADALLPGDDLVLRGRRMSRRAALDFDDIYQESNPDLLARYIDFERLVRARARAGLE